MKSLLRAALLSVLLVSFPLSLSADARHETLDKDIAVNTGDEASSFPSDYEEEYDAFQALPQSTPYATAEAPFEFDLGYRPAAPAPSVTPPGSYFPPVPTPTGKARPRRNVLTTLSLVENYSHFTRNNNGYGNGFPQSFRFVMKPRPRPSHRPRIKRKRPHMGSHRRGGSSTTTRGRAIRLARAAGRRGGGTPSLLRSLTPSPVQGNSGCTIDAVNVTYLGAEITWGSHGPNVPVHGKCVFDNNPAEPLFDGMNLHDVPIGTEQRIEFQSGAEAVTFFSRACFPNCDDPFMWDLEIGNEDLDNAVVLHNGDILNDVLMAKGIGAPFGGQTPISDIIADYLVDGVVTLADNEAIILYELGSLNPQSPAFDAQDSVFLISTECAMPVEVILRDSITSDPDYTSMNGYIPSGGQTGADETTVVEVPSGANDVTLKTLRIVVVPDGIQVPEFAELNLEVRLWNTLAEAQAAPRDGVWELTVNGAEANPILWGHTVVAFFGERDTYLIEFDLAPLGITIPAGESKWLGFSQVGSPKTLAVVESDELGAETDWSYNGSNNWSFTSDTDRVLLDGRAGMTLIATRN